MLTLAGCDRSKPRGENAEGGKAGVKEQVASTFLPPPGREAIERKLDLIRLPEVDFDDMNYERAFEWLEEQSFIHDLEDGTGVSFRFEGSLGSWRSVKVKFEDVSLREVLDYIAAQLDAAYVVTDEHVLIVQNYTIDDLTPYTRLYDVPEEFVRMVKGEESTVREALESQGIEFSEEAALVEYPDTGELLVKNVREQLLLVEFLFHQLGGETADEREARLAAIDAIETKLKETIIPSVEFEDLPFREAVAALQRYSVEYDTSPNNSAEKGVRIRIDLPEYEKPGRDFVDEFAAEFEEIDPVSPLDAKITIRLENVPVAEALRYVCALAYLRYRVDPPVVAIGHAGQTEETLYTRSYRLRPDVLSLSEDDDHFLPADPFGDGQSAEPTRSPMEIFFGKVGFQQHNKRSRLVFNEEDSTLIARDAHYSLDRLEEIVDALNSGGPDEWVEGEMARIEEKASRIVLPSVRFDKVPLERVLEYLELRSRELDTASGIANRGVRIRLEPGGVDPSTIPGLIGDDPSQPSREFKDAMGTYVSKQRSVRRHPVTLHLTNVSLSEVVASVAEQAGLKAYVEAGYLVVAGE